ncbi:MAG: membrane-associated, eicosanoid/glutathione metabolism protein [Piptocephalis tieghemiana]|nr:MAG: membrane-associated, eicosanoid/glutathione metabolism protein [Piptocephalis tieghemiana]
MVLILPVISIYSPLFVGYGGLLSSRVVASRIDTNLMLGDGSTASLEYRQCGEDKKAEKARHLTQHVVAHRNYLENVPLAMALIGLLELNGANRRLLHYLLGTLFVSRVAHAEFGIVGPDSRATGRIIGYLGTQAVILVATAVNALHAYPYFFNRR